MRQRPGGITLLAVIFIGLAILSLIWSVLVFGFGGLSWTTGLLFGAQGFRAFGGSSFWSGLWGMVTAIVQLIVAIGLLGLRRWAWFLALIAVGLTVITGLFGLFGGGFGAFFCGLLGLIIPIGILIYLLRPHVRLAFRA